MANRARRTRLKVRTRNLRYILRAVTRWAILSGLLAAGLFLAAGTTRIPMLRAYIAGFSTLLLVTMLAVDPGLGRERAHPGAGAQDGNLRFGAGFLFLVTVGFAAMDVGGLHQSDAVPEPVSIIALAVFAAALGLQLWAMMVNPFFSPALRIQAERSHHVITRGPYRWLRHPGYLAMIVAIPASAVAIGSWLALIPAAGFCAVIVRRARLEDEFLKRDLPGYIDYMERVPLGLLPRLSAIRAAVLVLAGLALLMAGLAYAATANSTAGLKLSPSPFNQQRAFQDLKNFAALGPRPPGSDAHDFTRLILNLSFMADGVDAKNVDFQTFEASTPVGKVEMTNVIAKIPGAQPDTIILGGHYDTSA
jgi:protein-S-isoprenylcysteine O-methyltransferase Ste14